LLEGDKKAFAAGGDRTLLDVMAVSHSGMFPLAILGVGLSGMSAKRRSKSFMPARDGWRQLWSIVAYVAFTTIAGCSWLPEKTGLLEQRHPETRINSGQLRLWTNDFILDYADRIEEAADRIKAQEPSAEIKRNTLLWKINAMQARHHRTPLHQQSTLSILTARYRYNNALYPYPSTNTAPAQMS
jgi:hypothetical protein